MTTGLPRRVRWTILGGAALFLLVVALVAGALIEQGRRNAIRNVERDATRFVSGAESALNRNLLSIDILLASLDEILNLSNLVADWIDVDQSSRLMRASDSQNLLVTQLALLTPQGKVLVSSARDGPQQSLQLPDGFLDEVLKVPVPTLTISAPFTSFYSSEPALYMARSVKLADSSKVIALAEVRVPLLATILEQGVAIPAWKSHWSAPMGSCCAACHPMRC